MTISSYYNQNTNIYPDLPFPHIHSLSHPHVVWFAICNGEVKHVVKLLVFHNLDVEDIRTICGVHQAQSGR